MLPEKEGTHKGFPMEWGVGESANGAVEFTIKFSEHKWWDGKEWIDTEGDRTIIGRFYPIKKDGSINETTARSLKEALGWNGTITHLDNGDFSQVEVQYTTYYEEYEGKRQMKVGFINPGDATPGGKVNKGGPSVVQSLEAKYGAVLRASGLTKTGGNGNGAAAPKHQPSKSEAEVEMGRAWAAFKTKFHDGTDEDRANLWRERMKSYFKKPREHVTAAEWRQFVADGFELKTPNPISEEPVFAASDIPF